MDDGGLQYWQELGQLEHEYYELVKGQSLPDNSDILKEIEDGIDS